MKHFRPFTIVFICLICLGCCAGGSLYFLSPYLPFGTWELVITPPVKAVQFIAYEYPNVFIRAEDSNMYVCEPLNIWQLRAGESSQHRCTQTNDIPKPINIPRCRPDDVWKPSPPSKIVDALSVRGCFPDGYVDIHFIVIDDGTVWHLTNSRGVYNAVPVLGGLGAVVGAVLSSIIFLGFRLVKIVRSR
jgi:hypothetical protein